MIGFWIAAALLSAAAAALVLYRAARLARQPEADPTVDVYKRQLGEIDDLAERGLLAESERRSARAEAARRLLTAADEAKAQPAAPSGSKHLRWAVVAGAVAAPLLAGALYFVLGSPGAPDQPFAERLAAWRGGDPNQLTAPQLAAVLTGVVRARPNDPTARLFLARAQAAAGDLPSAIETLRTAVRVSAPNADLWAALGEALVQQSQGVETPEALAAFRRTVALDPTKALSARYHLARAKIVGGDLAGGLADWRALASELPANQPITAELQQQIADTAKAGRLVEPQAQTQAQAPADAQAQAQADAQAQAQIQSATPQQQRAMIQSMVDSLAAKLKANPQDPAGWAQLIRSYGVLGETDQQAAARAEAERSFKGHPDQQKAFSQALAAVPQP